MREEGKAQVLLVGIEDALLWQLTRVLAACDDRIEVECARDFSVATEICANRAFDVIVVDGWEQPWQAGYSMGWDKLSGMRPRRWVILVDSIPVEGLFDERISSSVLFLEKPFNPKELPAFLLNALKEAEGREEGWGVTEEAGAAGEAPGEADVLKKEFLVPGERYRAAACEQVEGEVQPAEAEEVHPTVEIGKPLVEARTEAPARPVEPLEGMPEPAEAEEVHPTVEIGKPLVEARTEAPARPVEPPEGMPEPAEAVEAGAEPEEAVQAAEPVKPAAEVAAEEVRVMAEPEKAVVEREAAVRDFHALLEAGFGRLRAKDYAGAHEHWSKALALNPLDKRLQANLRNLKRHLPDAAAQGN